MINATPIERRALSRRKAICGLGAVAATTAASAFSGHQAIAAVDLDAPTEIAPGVFVHTGRHGLIDATNGGDIANLSFIIGSDAVAVIDTGGSADIGRALRKTISALTSKPIRYVINTHMHPDHVLGNSAFEGADVAFVAHHKMARSLAERAESYLRRASERLGDARFAGTKIVFPTRSVDAPTTLDLGSRQLTLIPRPTAHTDNDLTVFDSVTQTLIAGDLLFAEHIPIIDGSIVGWLALIDALAAESAQRVVPGHGPASMSWPDALKPMQRYLQTVAADVRAAIKSGSTMTEAVKTAGQSERPNWRLFDEHHARNVTAAFAELEWE